MRLNPLVRATALLVLAGAPLTSSVAMAGSESHPATHPTADRSGPYRAVLAALTQGEQVQVTIHFDQCTVAGAPGPAVTSGLHIDSFLAPKGKYIAFSDVHETLNAQYEKVTEYIRYKVQPDATVTVTTISVVAGQKPRTPTEFGCAVGKGADFHWRD